MACISFGLFVSLFYAYDVVIKILWSVIGIASGIAFLAYMIMMLTAAFHEVTTFHRPLREVDTIPYGKELGELYQALSIVPITSVEVERGFSISNHIYTDRKRSMTTDTVDMLVRIRLNGPPAELWNPTPYVDKWLRTGHKPSNHREAKKQDVVSNIPHAQRTLTEVMESIAKEKRQDL